MNLLEKYHIKNNVVQTYHNGVRVGNIPESKNKLKQSDIGQTRFTKNWKQRILKKQETHVASLKSNLQFNIDFSNLIN